MFCDSCFSEARSLSLVSSLEIWFKRSSISSAFRVCTAKYLWAKAICSLRGSPFWAIRYKITGISRKHVILYFPCRTTAQGNHFRDLTKMVINADSLCFTRFNSPVDCHLKVFPSCISQEWLKIPCEPNFHFVFTAIAFNIRSYRIKWGFVLDDTLFVHIVCVFKANLLIILSSTKKTAI